MPKLENSNKVSVTIRSKEENGELTLAEAKELIGWQTEAETGKEFGADFKVKDKQGNKVRLLNNPTNRPFRLSLAMKYASEMLRGKWQLNGETMVFDRKGHLQSAQHRLIGFILANQLLQNDPEAYPDLKKKELTVPCILVQGISEKKDVVDTLDLGTNRNLADVLFRNKEFGKKLTEKEQAKLARIYSVALRLTWLRAGGLNVSSAPHFPHSEALDFAEQHEGLKSAVEFVLAEDGSGDEKKRISKYVTLGYAAAMLYLMSASATAEGEELDYSAKAKAEDFWATFASGVSKGTGDLFQALRTRLANISASGAEGRDEICGTIIKAWELFIGKPAWKNQEIKVKDITVKRKKDGDRFVAAEEPRLGGLDVKVELEAVTDEQAEEAAAEVAEETKEEEAAVA